MPNSNLNASEVSQAKAWLDDIYVLADELQPIRPADYQHGYNWIKTRDVTAAKPAAKHVCRVLNSSLFESIDDDLKLIAKLPYIKAYGESATSLEAKGLLARSEIVAGQQLDTSAKLIATACAAMKLEWDPANSTQEEIDDFLDSKFGMALQSFGLIGKAEDINKPEGAQPQANAAQTSSIQAQAQGSQPATGTSAAQMSQSTQLMNRSRALARAAVKNGSYKSSGAQSANARDLKGTPNNKIHLAGNVYCIQGASTGKSPNVLFVDPILNKGEASGTNKVMYSTGHGYTDSTCFFGSPKEADDFLVKARAKGLATNAQVRAKKAASNGYFKVGTELGDCYILAVKLNEQIAGITEELFEKPEDSILKPDPKKSAYEQFIYDCMNAD